MAIKTFKHKGLEKFFRTGNKSKITVAHAKKLHVILDLLNAVPQAEEMNFPGSNFHSLKGDRKGFYAVQVSGNYVVIFRFRDGDAYDVNYLDYH